MPIYEYHCHGCGNAFETLVRSDTVPQCPQCRATGGLEKKLSTFATAAAGAETSAMPAGRCAGCCGHPDGPGGCGSMR